MPRPPRLHHQARERWARDLGVSLDAVSLLLDHDAIDLHIDSFIWTRLAGYDLRRRHGLGWSAGRLFSQVDFPRALEGGLTGATWVITTNPLRSAAGRTRTLVENLARLEARLASAGALVARARNFKEYQAAQDRGRHAAFIGIQGSAALDGDPDVVARLPRGTLLRVTLAHLYPSRGGPTSAPWPGQRHAPLGARGHELVERLNGAHVLVDLAHMNERAFWDALESHTPHIPPIVSHTGVKGAHDHWRNLSDEQLLAIARRGGTVGILYHDAFLTASRRACSSEDVARHIEHAVAVVGDEHVSLGSDWDGAIIPPRDLRSPLELPRLLQRLLDRGWGAERIARILGGNFLRVLKGLHGT